MSYKWNDVQSWIDACIEQGHRLTRWELNFLESVNDQLTMKGHLSQNQVDVVERIYTEKVK